MQRNFNTYSQSLLINSTGMDSFTFENYKILHLIGEGSFGKVFKAAENETKKNVALKILIKVSFIFICLCL